MTSDSDLELHERAIALWLEGGTTSRTHPVLAAALERCFAPLGIKADWLECEPFGALECGTMDVWLRSPRADSGAVDVDGILQPPPGSGGSTWSLVGPSVEAHATACAYLAACAGALLCDRELALIYCTEGAVRFADEVWARLDAARARKAAESDQPATPVAAPASLEAAQEPARMLTPALSWGRPAAKPA